MIARHRLDAVPEQRPELIGEGKIGKPFAVDPPLAFSDLKADRSKQFAIGALSDLKFGDSFAQFFRPEMHGLP